MWNVARSHDLREIIFLKYKISISKCWQLVQIKKKNPEGKNKYLQAGYSCLATSAIGEPHHGGQPVPWGSFTKEWNFDFGRSL